MRRSIACKQPPLLILRVSVSPILPRSLTELTVPCTQSILTLNTLYYYSFNCLLFSTRLCEGRVHVCLIAASILLPNTVPSTSYTARGYLLTVCMYEHYYYVKWQHLDLLFPMLLTLIVLTRLLINSKKVWAVKLSLQDSEEVFYSPDYFQYNFLKYSYVFLYTIEPQSRMRP